MMDTIIINQATEQPRHFKFVILTVGGLIAILFVGSLIVGYEAGYGLAFDLTNTFISFTLGMGLRKLLPRKAK